MFIIGLTGGIGSGKSAATNYFQKLGVTIVDADIAARIVVEPNTPGLIEIEKYFDSSILQTDGSLDRAKLRSLIFADDKKRQWLESLLHPLIAEEIQQQLKDSTSAYTILVSPLLLETQQHQWANRILLIDVPVELQINRTTSRDNNTAEQVESIIKVQMPREDKQAKADDIALNDKDLNHLHTEITTLHKKYLKLAQESLA